MGGENKALIEIDGKTIIQMEIEVIERVLDRIIIITNKFDQYAFLKKPMFSDVKPGYGSLGGIFTGLNFCSTEYGFVFACDMPFLNEEIVSHICWRSLEHDITIPRIDGHFEPLHAIYSCRCVRFMEKLMQTGDLKITNLLNEVDILEIGQKELERIDPYFRFRINVNTPEDLAKAIKMAGPNFPRS